MSSETTSIPEFRDTKHVDCRDGSLTRLAANFQTYFPGCAAMVVADPNTWNAAGREVYVALKNGGVACATPYVYEAPPFENLASCRLLDAAWKAAKIPEGAADLILVAVGSGSLNDICKYVSGQAGKPYACFATAASVDGFASFGAAMGDDAGFKITRPCPAPRLICAEPNVLLRAPKYLTSSGYGDLFAKFTGGADWIIANEIINEEIQSIGWGLVQRNLAKSTLHPKELLDGDANYTAELFEMLTRSGLAMQYTQSSRPASGAEHLFSHVWEMSRVKMPNGEYPTHGHKVALGVVAEFAMFAKLFEHPFTVADIPATAAVYPKWDDHCALIRATFGDGEMGDRVVAEAEAKFLKTPEEIHARLSRIAERWEPMRERLDLQLMPFQRARAMLHAADCPVTPAPLGLTPERVGATVLAAQMIRRRYTVLDLAFETGRLPLCAAAVIDAMRLPALPPVPREEE